MKKFLVIFFSFALIMLISGSVSHGEHRPPIFRSITNNDIKAVKDIITRFPNVIEDRGYPCDTTPLIYAASMGRKEIVEFLISRGANLNAQVVYYQQFKGCTALHFAAWSGHKEVVQLLLKAGAKYDIKDAKGKTPLAYAVMCQKKDVIRILQAEKYKHQQPKKEEQPENKDKKDEPVKSEQPKEENGK